jgi:protoheme IX farnesyltransferase
MQGDLKRFLKRMSQEKTIANSTPFVLASTVKDYFQLTKFTLSFMVVFSTVMSYLIATDYRNALDVILLFLAGMLITGSANTINQVAEKDTDALMKRTAGRPGSQWQNDCEKCEHLCGYNGYSRVANNVAEI